MKLSLNVLLFLVYNATKMIFIWGKAPVSGIKIQLLMSMKATA